MNGAMQGFKYIADIVTAIALYALFFLLPAFFAPVLWMTVPQAKVFLITVLLAISSVGLLVSAALAGTLRIPRAWPLLVALFLPIAYGISVWVSGSGLGSLWGAGIEQDTLAAVSIWYALLCVVSVFFSDNIIKSVFAVRAFFLGTFALYALEFFHLLSPLWGTFGGLLPSLLANPFGGWYEFGIFSGFAFFFSLLVARTLVARGLWRPLVWAVAAFSFLSLVLVNSVDVWVVLAISALLYVAFDVAASKHWYVFRHPEAWGRYLGWFAVAAVSVLLFFFGGVVTARLPDALRISFTEVRPSWTGTFIVGSQTLSDPARIAFGVGPNTFAQQWSQYKPIEVNQTAFWDTSFEAGIGLIPTSLITVGAFGVVAWGLLILSIIWLAFRLAHVTPRQGAQLLVEPLFFGAIFLLVFHIIYVPGPALNSLAFIVLGLGIAYAASLGRISHLTLHTQGTSLRAVLSTGIIIAFALLALGATLGTLRVLVAETMVNKSILRYNQTGDLKESSDIIARALRIYPQSARGQRAAVELGVIQIRQLLVNGGNDKAAEELRAAVERTITQGLMAVSLNEKDYLNWLELAAVYQFLAEAQVQGAYENARETYSKIIEDHPTNPIPYLRRAQLESLGKQYDAAIADVTKAVELKPDLAAAHYLASQIFAVQGKYKDAAAPAYSALQLAQQDPLAWYNFGAIAYAAGVDADAVKSLEQAVTLEPNYADALYVLGLAYHRVGRTEDAIRTLERIQEINPGQKAVEEALTQMRAGATAADEKADKKLAPADAAE